MASRILLGFRYDLARLLLDVRQVVWILMLEYLLDREEIHLLGCQFWTLLIELGQCLFYLQGDLLDLGDSILLLVFEEF